MKRIVLFCIIFLSFNAYSQTKEEIVLELTTMKDVTHNVIDLVVYYQENTYAPYREEQFFIYYTLVDHSESIIDYANSIGDAELIAFSYELMYLTYATEGDFSKFFYKYNYHAGTRLLTSLPGILLKIEQILALPILATTPEEIINNTSNEITELSEYIINSIENNIDLSESGYTLYSQLVSLGESILEAALETEDSKLIQRAEQIMDIIYASEGDFAKYFDKDNNAAGNRLIASLKQLNVKLEVQIPKLF